MLEIRKKIHFFSFIIVIIGLIILILPSFFLLNIEAEEKTNPVRKDGILNLSLSKDVAKDVDSPSVPFERFERLERIWLKISEKIDRIILKTRNFWNYTILPRFQIYSQEEKRDSWKERIRLFFIRQYEQRKLIIQRELEKEKRELIQLTPSIIIEIWEILKYFYLFLRDIVIFLRDFLRDIVIEGRIE